MMSDVGGALSFYTTTSSLTQDGIIEVKILGLRDINKIHFILFCFIQYTLGFNVMQFRCCKIWNKINATQKHM